MERTVFAQTDGAKSLMLSCLGNVTYFLDVTPSNLLAHHYHHHLFHCVIEFANKRA